MDINNIALVRVTNVIPFDGVVRPISNVPYLCKNIGLEYSNMISDLLKELNIIPPIDQSKMFDEGYYDEYVSLSSKILKEYFPYVTDYNSMVLFSLNGICPDDNEHGFGNNIFSNKKVAIIEPLSHHIDQTISLVPTDTALKGDVYLSKDAIILIEENIYNSLSEHQKSLLNDKCIIKTFKGSIKDAISNELQISGKYTPETLSLSSSTGGVMPSNTSEELKMLINSIAQEYGLSQMKYFNLITSMDSSMNKYEEVCDEFSNALKVQDYYIQKFIKEILIYVNASTDLINSVSKSNIHNRVFLEKIKEIIKTIGIDKYKQFVDIYNKKLEEEQRTNKLLTPEEIVSISSETKSKNR